MHSVAEWDLCTTMGLNKVPTADSRRTCIRGYISVSGVLEF